ncbi:MAG TPA: hypothetical protein VE953_24700 [Terriglobales bacterium]|nr:hypothetical protein [Terriglobales bacterium]
MEPRKGSGRVGWILAGAVVVVAALLFVVGALTTLPPLSSQAGAYLADRNLGLAVLLVALLALRWTRTLAVVLLGTAVIHLVDAAADAHFALWAAAAGSVVVAVASAAAAAWLFRQSSGQTQSSMAA